jgi:hypothetical protein
MQFSSSVPGVFSVEVNATSSSLTQTTFIFVKVLSTAPGLDISTDPVLVNFTAGQTGSSTINLASVNNFAGLANLTPNVFSAVFPAPLAVGFSRDSVKVLPGGTNSSTATFSSSTPGFYTVALTVTADDISSGLIVHNQTYVYVNVIPSTTDFSVSAFPSIVSIGPSFSSASRITLQSVNGFQGLVTLASSPSPDISDVSVSFRPKSITLTSGSTNDSIATFSSSFQGPTAEFVIVNATSGPVHHAAAVEVVIEPATLDFSLSASAPSLSISQGGTGSSMISVSSINGFSGDVRLSLSSYNSSEFAASLSLITVSLSSGSPAAYTQLSVCTTANKSLGTRSLEVAGMSGTSFHVVTVTLTLIPPTPPPLQSNFTISANPDSMIIREGNTGSSTITIVASNGFASDVSLTATVSPSGPATSFSPATVTAGAGTSILTIHTTTSQGTGLYTVTVVGTSGSLSRQFNVSLTVTSPSSAPSSSSSIFGLSPTLFYGTIGGIILGIAAIAVIAFRLRKPSTSMASRNRS